MVSEKANMKVKNLLEEINRCIEKYPDFLNTLSKEDLSIVKQMVKTKQTGMVQ